MGAVVRTGHIQIHNSQALPGDRRWRWTLLADDVFRRWMWRGGGSQGCREMTVEVYLEVIHIEGLWEKSHIDGCAIHVLCYLLALPSICFVKLRWHWCMNPSMRRWTQRSFLSVSFNNQAAACKVTGRVGGLLGVCIRPLDWCSFEPWEKRSKGFKRQSMGQLRSMFMI